MVRCASGGLDVMARLVTEHTGHRFVDVVLAQLQWARHRTALGKDVAKHDPARHVLAHQSAHVSRPDDAHRGHLAPHLDRLSHRRVLRYLVPRLHELLVGFDGVVHAAVVRADQFFRPAVEAPVVAMVDRPPFLEIIGDLGDPFGVGVLVDVVDG